MGKYIIPFFYTFYTRIKGMGKRIGYFLTFIIPVFLYAGVVAYQNEFSFIKVGISIIISLIGTMSIYEIGYIRNDVFTIKKEKNPTLRLKREELNYVENKVGYIFTIKYIITILSGVIMYFIGLNWELYIIGLILIEVFYFIHNSIRGKKSILSFFVLSTLRYVVPLSILKTNIIITIWVFIVSISILRTFEKAAEKKFKIKALDFVGTLVNTHIIRAIYYLILVVIILGQYMTFKLPIVFLVLGVYYLLYRGGVAIGYIAKNKLRKN